MTTIIRARAAHDFLALVPTLVGYLPSRSLLCVAFDGNRTAGVLRHDLPRDAADREVLVTAVVGTLCRMPHVDAVVPVAYTDVGFAGGGVPEAELLAAVVQRAEQAGFLVRDALCVAADGWGSLLDDELPAGGRALDLVAGSAVARHPGALRDPAASAADLVRIPPADPARSAEVAEVLATLRASGIGCPDASDDEVVGTPTDALASLDAAIGDALDPFVAAERLATGRAGQTPEMLAWLVHLAACPPFRDALMLQVAFGPVVGELALDCADRAAELPAASTGWSTPASDEAASDDRAESTEEFLSRLLLGMVETRPDVGRIERSIETLAVAAAHAPSPDRAGVLCVTAWLAWALGRSSAGGALIDQALAADPGNTMAALLRRFFGSGALPDWAFGPDLTTPSERDD
ncbi:hypothetical protein BCL57_002508 [Agromyces flavus]|uniref:DUF4192 domain-containing protein n=1 Tax=Agromyces flavus TaxID=589382 RepID=A0A1H1TWQ0_9MICO|nr:DUF4192 family protein [Agromyces flavus]MCP2368335.1 hypothetical protein [Agromyces flavus]GGI47797.1 hypothetical protein GCM10010932_24850 [Agromyces flavus]SDS64715.1 protein of unknown function [Agromyces flavus]